MSGKFPLPPNFFRCPPLTPEESSYMSDLARKSFLDLVRHSRIEGGPIKWTLDSDEGGLQIYSGKDPTAPTDMRVLCSTTEVMATIEEAAALFRLETTELFREYLRMFAKDLLDAASLYTLAMPTEQRPRHYIGVKWTCVESPSSLIKNRDWCYLECQDDFEMNGRRGWARALSSIKLPCCPDLQNSLGIVRAAFYRTGYVFLESNRPGYLQVIHAIQVDFRGNIPSWVIKFGMKRRARSIGEIDHHLREKRLGGEKFLADHDLVPKLARSKCFLCHKKHGTFTKKHNCRRCGEVVCSSCSKFWNVSMNGHRVHVRVCTGCSIGGRTINQKLSVRPLHDNASMTGLVMEAQIQPSVTPFDRKSAPGQGKLRRGREDDCGVVYSNDVYKLPTTTTGGRSRKQPESLAVQVGADDHHSNVQQHEYIYSQSVQLAYASTGNLKASTPEYPSSSNLVADQSVGDGPAQYSYESSHGDCYDDYHQQQQAAGYHEEYYYPHDQYNTPAFHQMYRYDGGYYEQGGGAYGKAGGEGYYPPTPGILPHDPRYDHDLYDDEAAAVRRDGEEFPATTYHDQDECPVHVRPYQGDGYYSYQDKQQGPRQQQDTRSTKAKADADAMAALFRDMESMGLKPAAVAPRAA